MQQIVIVHILVCKLNKKHYSYLGWYCGAMNNFRNGCQALRVVCRRLFWVSGSVGFLTTLQSEYTLLSEMTVLYYCTAIWETYMQEGPHQCTINKTKQTNFLLC